MLADWSLGQDSNRTAKICYFSISKHGLFETHIEIETNNLCLL
jgi:hypothetical protein